MTRGRRGSLALRTWGSHIPISTPVYPGAPRTHVRMDRGQTINRGRVALGGAVPNPPYEPAHAPLLAEAEQVTEPAELEGRRL
jgi:hypothetical protein